jgi:hypothetical protein
MSVRNDESGRKSQENLALAHFFIQRKRSTREAKCNASFERKIERLWRQSSDAGWSFNDFAVHLLEVLIILRNRDALKLASAAKPKIVAS